VRGEASGNEDRNYPEISDQIHVDSVETILGNLEYLYQGILQHSVKLAALHPAVIKQWPEMSALYIVARFSQWRHIIDDHPGQFTAWEVMATLNDPTRIRRDKHYIGENGRGLRVIYYRDRPDGSALLVVVDIRNANLGNQVRTAFHAAPGEVKRRLEIESLIWDREEETGG
jgi:hypothetical protein